ncbi:MAG: hypothetical protein IPG29_16830 [Sphingobacteriales bacterium]|nr:hypothetical protein [Sphingobacteriales bacterium]
MKNFILLFALIIGLFFVACNSGSPNASKTDGPAEMLNPKKIQAAMHQLTQLFRMLKWASRKGAQIRIRSTLLIVPKSWSSGAK